MKNLCVVLILVVVMSGCKNEVKTNYDDVKAGFDEFSRKIRKVKYKVHAIDTFTSGGVWNHNGFALVEKDATDKMFGFSFYGKRSDVAEDFLYDKGNGFVISKEKKSYKVERHSRGFLGSPGGQMISPHIFDLDSIYRNVKVVEEGDKYIVTYEFEDDTTYHITDHYKILELDKNNFFPTKITRSYTALGKKATHQKVLSDITINEEVKNSIANYKQEFADFDMISEKPDEPNKILNSRLPEIGFPNVLSDDQEVIKFQTGKVTLIDFWEVWCGPCIKSFPEVEKLKTKYKDKLQVVGIVTENKESAVRLIKETGATFLNLFAPKEYLKELNIIAYPTYFLIDGSGIVQKEYRGFSRQIEADIKKMIFE